MGPAAYNLGQHRVLLTFMKSLRDTPLDDCRQVLLTALHDDMYLLGEPTALKAALERPLNMVVRN